MIEEEVLTNKTNNKRKWILIITILVIILLSGGGYYYYTNYYKTNKNELVKPSLKDDFYENINFETIRNAKIPSDSGSWSKAYDASKIIEKRHEELTNEILSDPNYKNPDIDIMVELYTDYEGRNKRGLSEIQSYIDMIDKAKTIKEFNDVLMTLDKDMDDAILISYEGINDFYDTSKMVLFISPIVIDGVPFEMFTESKYSVYIPFAEQEMTKYFEQLNYSKEKIDDLIKKLEEFVKEIQSKSIVQSNVTDMFELYKKYTLDEIDKEIKNLPIKRLLQELKLDKEEYYLVPDMGHYKALDEYYKEENLSLLKEFAKLEIIGAVFSSTSTENVKFELDLSNTMSGTSVTMEEYEKNSILAIKSSYILDEIQKRYEEKYFTAEDKKIVKDLVEEIIKYYKEVINNADWLSDTTKVEAITKLDNMKVNIGYQEKEKTKEEEYKPVSKANGGTLISNLIGANRFNHKNYYKQFNKAASVEDLNTLEVNAYYQPTNNSINFLAGYKEMYANETDYYRLMGYFGIVIGHEISHAFDNTGSKFDENGKVKDWWTKEDKDNYEQLAKKIEEYYSKYEFMGFKVDGKKTLGENIADLASMKAMISIAESKGATKEDYKKMFEAYADLYVQKTNEEAARQASLADNHSPDKVRVNAVLSSTDKFYEVYDIKEGDKMYVPKENRVSLW